MGEREERIKYLAKLRYPVSQKPWGLQDRVASRDHYADCLRELTDNDLEMIWKSRMEFERTIKGEKA
jgi:hypothetical protein